MVNSNDIVSGVYARLGTANIPSEIGSMAIVDLVNDRVLDIGYTYGTTFSGDDVPAQFVSPLKDLATADVVARMLGIDIDTEIGVGNIRLAYKDIYTAENRQIQYFLEKAEKSLQKTGIVLRHGTTIKVN